MQIFEFWQCWSFFGFGRSRDQGGTLPRARFTPSALVQRSTDPNRPCLSHLWVLLARVAFDLRLRVDQVGVWLIPTPRAPEYGGGPRYATHPLLKVDRMRHGPQNPKMVQKWSDLGPPTSGQVHWGEMGPRKRFPLVPGRAGPKKAQNCQTSKHIPRSTFRGGLLLRRSTLKEGCAQAPATLFKQIDSPGWGGTSGSP